MAFFDFLGRIAPYGEAPEAVARLNLRHAQIVAPLAGEIAGARVLDLAAHDGRWSLAFAGAGAAEVLGIEGRPELIARFDQFPKPALKARVRLVAADIFDALEAEVAAGAQVEVVAVLGIFYHILDHFRLLRLITALRPRLVIVDSEFAIRGGPVIQLVRERTDNPLNAIPQRPGQERALIGIPSHQALEAMAEVLGYATSWVDWTALPEARRGPVADYYRTEQKRRGTCLLRPV